MMARGSKTSGKQGTGQSHPRIGKGWEPRTYHAAGKAKAFIVRRNPVTAKIEKAPVEGKKEPKSFDAKYDQKVHDDKGMMRKKLPEHVRDAVGDLARSRNEYAIGVDFEALDDLPERILINRGSESMVQRDADFELHLHTHPPTGLGHSKAEGAWWTDEDKKEIKPGFGITGTPSGGDLAATNFYHPNIIAYIDESGQRRYVLVRSLHKTRLPTSSEWKIERAHFDGIVRALLGLKADEAWSGFKTRAQRNEFMQKFKKALNEEGYDFKATTLRHVIPVRFDDNDERKLELPRYNTLAKQVQRDFKARQFLVEAGVHGWFTSDGKRFEVRVDKDLPATTIDAVKRELREFQDKWNFAVELDPMSETMPSNYYNFTIRGDGVFKKLQYGAQDAPGTPSAHVTFE